MQSPCCVFTVIMFPFLFLGAVHRRQLCSCNTCSYSWSTLRTVDMWSCTCRSLSYGYSTSKCALAQLLLESRGREAPEGECNKEPMHTWTYCNRLVVGAYLKFYSKTHFILSLFFYFLIRDVIQEMRKQTLPHKQVILPPPVLGRRLF